MLIKKKKKQIDTPILIKLLFVKSTPKSITEIAH